jgi:hypothetical protein
MEKTAVFLRRRSLVYNYFAESSIAFAAGATKLIFRRSKEEVSVYFAFDIPKKRYLKPCLDGKKDGYFFRSVPPDV